MDSFIKCPGESQMNIHVTAWIQSVHHQHAHVISDGHATGQSQRRWRPSQSQTKIAAFSQVVDVMNFCFVKALLHNTPNK